MSVNKAARRDKLEIHGKSEVCSVNEVVRIQNNDQDALGVGWGSVDDASIRHGALKRISACSGYGGDYMCPYLNQRR